MPSKAVDGASRENAGRHEAAGDSDGPLRVLCRRGRKNHESSMALAPVSDQDHRGRQGRQGHYRRTGPSRAPMVRVERQGRVSC